MDSACIPKNAPHQGLALEFINDCGFNSPNRYSARNVEEWIRQEPAIFPPPASLVHCEFMRDLGPVTALYDRYWTEIKAR